MKCEVDPQLKTCDCEPPCGAQCVECGKMATAVVSFNLFFDAYDEEEEDCEVWVCGKCLRRVTKDEDKRL